MTRSDYIKALLGAPIFVLVLVGLCFGFWVLELPQVAHAYEHGTMPPLLPAPGAAP